MVAWVIKDLGMCSYLAVIYSLGLFAEHQIIFWSAPMGKIRIYSYKKRVRAM